MIGIVEARAQAAEAVDAQTRCGSGVTWSVTGSTSTIPDGAEVAIEAAWAQVAGPARLTVTAGDPGSTRWQWLNRGTGETGSEGAYEASALLGDPYWLHARVAPLTGVPLRQQMLTDVLADVGVTSPSSRDGRLSAQDRAAIARVCAAQAAEPSPSPSAEVAGEPVPQASPSVDPDVSPDPSEQAVALPGDQGNSPVIAYGLIALGGLLVGGYLALPVIKSRRKRGGRDDAVEVTS